MDASKTILICGMHRSGTSLTASLLASCGVALGHEMIPADERNRHGYFEDAEVVRLHQGVLAAATEGGCGGHPDWGWTEDETLDLHAFEARASDFADLIHRRRGIDGWWGFKDPRTSVALDFWDRQLGGAARYLFVYRFPWQVADSMQRLGAGVFLRHPEYAYRIWSFYNRKILSFCRRHRERCLLVSTNALVAEPTRLADLLEDRFGVKTDRAALGTVFRERDLESTGADDPIAAWTLDAYPELRELCRELDAEADLPNSCSYAQPAVATRTSGEEPRVTVVIPCLDHGELLLDALASVERAIAIPHQVIIVDDGSTAPETLRILDLVRVAGYEVLVQENRGLAAARNVGIEHAEGDYILALDADNRIRAGFVEEAVALLDARSDVGVVYGDRHEFGQRSGRQRVGAFDLPRILWRNYIDACALFRREVWRDVGGYDEELDVLEDWAFWIAVASAEWRFEHLDVVAFDYRVRPGSLVTHADVPEVGLRVRARVLERHRETYRRHFAQVVQAGWQSQA